MLTFRDTHKKFALNGDLLKNITNKNYNVDLSSILDKKLLFEFAKEVNFDEEALGNQSVWDNAFFRLLKSPAIKAKSLRKKFFSNPLETSTRFLSFNHNKICDRLKFLIQEKQAGSNCYIFKEDIVALTYKLWEYKCMSTKQHSTLVELFL